jgi:hypothetical protein
MDDPGGMTVADPAAYIRLPGAGGASLEAPDGVAQVGTRRRRPIGELRAGYIGRKRCPNARLTFKGLARPRTARL